MLCSGRGGTLGCWGEAAGGQAGVPGTWEELAGGRCAICTVQNTVSAKKRMATNRKNGERGEGRVGADLQQKAARGNGGDRQRWWRRIGGAAGAPTPCHPRWGNPWSCLSVAFDRVPMKRYRMYRMPTLLAAVIILKPKSRKQTKPTGQGS